MEVEDPDVLTWADENNRIVLTHDHRTMPKHAYARMAVGKGIPGVFIISDRLPIGQSVQELLLLNECSQQAEWRNRVVYLPL